MPDQVMLIPFNEQQSPDIGMGFNSQAGEFVGTALSVGSLHTSTVAPGQFSQGSALIINSHEELMEHIDGGFSASGRYGLASGSAKMNFSNETRYNSTSTFVLAQTVVDNAMTRGASLSVTPEATALLNANRMDDFHRAFGDSFVRGIKSGGEYFAVVRITSVDQSSQSALGASLAAEVNGLVAGGSFQAQFSHVQQSTSGRTEVLVSFYQASGQGVTAGATLDVASVIQRVKDFSTIVKDNPVGVTVEIASYDTVPIPVPTLEEIQDLQIALDDAQAKRLLYLTTKNDLEFAMANPQFFVGLPAHEQMQQAVNAYTDALNKVMQHAVDLAKGKINPAKVFDTSTVNLPPPITLTRAPAAPVMVTVPDCVHHVEFFDEDNHPETGLLRGVLTIGNSIMSLPLSYKVQNVSGADPADVDAGVVTVVAQSPPAGTQVPAGSTVILQV